VDGDVLGPVLSTAIPTNDGGIEIVPAFYSKGSVIEAGWVVPMKPVTLWWSGPDCGVGTPYVKDGGNMLLSNLLHWTPIGSGNLYQIDWDAPTSTTVYIGRRQQPTSIDNIVCANTDGQIPSLLPLDQVPIGAYLLKYSVPWEAAPRE
jgi:hypothetical protein